MMPPTQQQQLPLVHLSMLESLPVELIQRIFELSLEINFPRASIHIARILSTPALYTWLIRLAFSSDNESSKRGFFTSDYLPQAMSFFSLSREQRAALQSAILECKWCTLPLMRKCQREYIEHAIRQKCQGLVFSPEDQRTLSNLRARFVDMRDYDHGHGGRRGKGDLILPATKPDIEGDTETVTRKDRGRDRDQKMIIAIWVHFGAMQIRKPGPVYFATDIFRLPSCADNLPARMPDKLLQPPWTESKFEFFQLLSLDAYVDEDKNCNRSKRVLRQLIRSRDIKTFQRLLSTHIRQKDYNYPIPWPVRKCHFHDAIDYAEGKSDPFVKELFLERWDDVPMRDTRLREVMMALMY